MKEQILREVPEKREKCVKHFQMAQKGMAAAIYPVPVHYEEDGEWKEIDNRLEAVEEGGKRVYRNHGSSVRVSFAETADEEELVSLEKEGMKLSWRIETPIQSESTQNVDSISIEKAEIMDAESTQVIVQEIQPFTSCFRVLTESEFWNAPEKLAVAAVKGTEEKTVEETVVETATAGIIGLETAVEMTTENEEDTDNSEGTDITEIDNSGRLEDSIIRQMMGVPHLVSEGIYDDILLGIDLHYAVQGEQIKENIRLKTKEAAVQPLIFSFTHPGLNMQKDVDGGIGVYRVSQDGGEGENESEQIYKLVKPYMYDQAGSCSQNVEFRIDSQEDRSIVTIVPDLNWLMAEGRAYPVVIDPMTETSKTKANIEDTYIFSGGNASEDASAVYAYGSFLAGKSDELGKMRALLRFKNLPDIGKGSIIYAATMYIWQYEYSTYGTLTIPLMAHEIKNNWAEKTARWSNQPSVDSHILDYKKVGQVRNGNTITITPIGFDVTRLVRQWYNTGNNYGIMIRSKYEEDTTLANRAYARFYSSDHPQMSSDQYPSGVFFYRNVNGLEDYQSYHEQSAGRAGTGYVNDFTGNLVWIHQDVQTDGGPLQASIRHIYNSSEAGTSSRQGYGWTLDCLQKMTSTGITDYPYVYTDKDGTKHYFYKDTSDGNKLKDEDGLGFVITATSGADYDHNITMETKDKVKYIFGKDGFIRFIEDLDGNKITYEYEPNSTQNYIDYITDATGGRVDIVYKQDASLSRILAVKDTAGRSVQYVYDNAGNLSEITYPDGKKTIFTYDSSHKLLSVTNPNGYRVKYNYTSDFRIPRVSKITETGTESTPGQELKISYENGNTTIFEEPGLDGELGQTSDNKKITYHFDNMGRPTDVQDSGGYANNYTYYTSGMKNHKLSKDGSVQKTVYGLLKNQLFASTNDWYTYRTSDGQKGTIVRTDGYSGTKSVKLVKMDASSEEGICQDVTLQPGTYTLSAYMKTAEFNDENNSGKGAGLAILHANQKQTLGERYIDYATDEEVDNGWERLSLTFQLEQEESVKVFAGIFGMKGTLYVSGVQLETGVVANKLNLIMNPGFEYCTNNVPDNWTFSGTATKSVVTSERGRCAALTGDIEKNVSCMQGVSISGQEGDIFHLSCWVKGLGIPGKQFSISAAVIYSDDSVKWHHFKCNPNINGWQFVNNTFSTDDEGESTKKAYKAIHVYLMCYNQANQILFKGVQLIKDDGETYQYDEEGNLVNAESAAEKLHFVSDKKGSLTRMGNLDGTSFEYGYDEKNHLVRAANSEGVRYAFDYNTKGQPIKMTVEGGKHLKTVTPGRTYYIREKVSGKYLDVKGAAVQNNTIIQLYQYNGGIGQKWKVEDCGKGYVFLELADAFGYRLDLKGMSDTDGATVQLYSANNSDAQKWKIHPKKDGSYQISNRSTKDKRGLSNATKSTENSQAVQSYTLAETNLYQDWYFESADEGTISAAPGDGKIVSIRVRHSGQYIDVQGFKNAAGSRTMQYFGNGGLNQQFRMSAADDTYYLLEPLHAPGMVLAKNGANSGGYPILALAERASGAPSQMFRFEEVETGKGTGYAIICKDGNVALDVMNYDYKQSTDIILTAHKSAQVNKWWILEECSEWLESAMTYTSDGRQVESMTDSRGNVVRYEYDSNNRLLMKALDVKGNATSYTYDADTDQLTGVQKSVGKKAVKVAYTYENDRIKSITHNGFNYTYGYDAYGNLESVSAGESELEHTIYRNRNGLTDRVTYVTGEAIRNEYNEEEQLAGQYLVKVDGTEEKLFTNTYDAYGNVVKHEDHRNGVVNSYQYDMIGRLLGTDSSDGMKLRIVYDGKNRVKSYVYRVDKSGNQTEFIYGDTSRQQRPGLGYGVRINGTDRIHYEYDPLARMTKQMLLCSDTVTKETQYTYIPGKREGITTNLVASVKEATGTVYYNYDENGNITEISKKEAGSQIKVRQVRYEYDELNQLIQEGNKEQDKTITYTYDVGGNLTVRKEYPYTEEAVITTTATKTDTYTYRTSGWKDQLIAYNGQAITYDALGNPIQYRSMAMEWEKGHTLKKITASGLVQTCTYDSDGNRIRKTINGVTTEYYLNGAAIIAQKTSDGKRIDFLYDEKGNVFALIYQKELYYYRKNIQGDILGIIDKTGTEVVTYTYDSWGRLTGVMDQTGINLGRMNPFRYRGYCYDDETGFYYVSKRYYDPEVGRFISADTTDILGVSNDLYDKNLYAYCDNNPVMRKDSSGEIWIAAVAAGVAAQYTGDVIGNLLAGKTGTDIFIPKSTVGEYVAAGVTALIPGSGFTGSLIRNVAAEAIVSVERHVKGQVNSLAQSAKRVAFGTVIDTGMEKVTSSVTKHIESKMPRNYSSYAGQQYKKKPRITQKQIRQNMSRSVRWGTRISNCFIFIANAVRSVFPW